MKSTDTDDMAPNMGLGDAAKLFQGEWSVTASTDRSTGIVGREVAEPFSVPTTAFQQGLESSYPEFSQLFAAIESRTACIDHKTEGADRRNTHVLGITSALVGEGKTTVALNLAMSTVRSSNRKVCLIDLGLTGESVLQRLGCGSGGSGIIQVLEGESQTFPMLKFRDFEEMTVIPAGKVPSNPARIARSPHLKEVLESARRMFDLILIDMPAIATHNARPMAEYMDSLVMIACAGVTPQDVIVNAMDHIGREKVLGVVLNRIRFAGPRWLQNRLNQR